MDKAKDYPGLVTASAIGFVIGHFALVRWTKVPALPKDFVASAEASELYLGAAGVVAVLAGFSGVVIMFGLTPGVPVLEAMRKDGGKRLRANWISLVSNPVCAALLFLLAASLAVAGHPRSAGWVFELAAILTVLGGLRTMWLFRGLASKDLEHQPPQEANTLELVTDALAVKQKRRVGGSS